MVTLMVQLLCLSSSLCGINGGPQSQESILDKRKRQKGSDLHNFEPILPAAATWQELEPRISSQAFSSWAVCQGIFKMENGRLRYLGKRPIEVGRRPSKVGKLPVKATGLFQGTLPWWKRVI